MPNALCLMPYALMPYEKVPSANKENEVQKRTIDFSVMEICIKTRKLQLPFPHSEVSSFQFQSFQCSIVFNLYYYCATEIERIEVTSNLLDDRFSFTIIKSSDLHFTPYYKSTLLISFGFINYGRN